MQTTIQFKHNANATVYPFDSLDELAARTAHHLHNKTVGLSGGSTFRHLFPLWIYNHPDCRQTAFFPVDERMVPFEDHRSNWGTAYRLFFKPLGKQAEKSHFASSVKIYKQILDSFFETRPPVFDVIFLGVGGDGHTASLFPNQPYLSDRSSTVLQTRSPVAPFDRITLAPRVLIAARKLITIVGGAEKKDIVKGIFQKNGSLPIVRILSEHPASLLYVDKQIMP
ncbi:MAG: 6-phosphogluconolactonase [Chitinivibrionales bacterium]